MQSCRLPDRGVNFAIHKLDAMGQPDGRRRRRRLLLRLRPSRNDLVGQDFRSRDKSWDYGRIALDFFRSQNIPFWLMTNADALVGNPAHDNSRWCFAQPGRLYLVYLPSGGTTELDLTGTTGPFDVQWFDPRNGGGLKRGSVARVTAGGRAALGAPPDNPAEDWLVVVRTQLR
jgi:collagenase-like protein with putative collagen-binding domain